MGLLDILNGMQNGPRGQRTPTPAGSGGMSPIAMAVLGLLAYKAIKHLSPGQSNAGTTNPNVTAPAGTSAGGLGGLLQGLLGGGLNDLLKQFQQSGLSDVAQSWVNTGPNKEISPNDLSKVLGDDQIK